MYLLPNDYVLLLQGFPHDVEGQYLANLIAANCQAQVVIEPFEYQDYEFNYYNPLNKRLEIRRLWERATTRKPCVVYDTKLSLAVPYTLTVLKPSMVRYVGKNGLWRLATYIKTEVDVDRYLRRFISHDVWWIYFEDKIDVSELFDTTYSFKLGFLSAAYGAVLRLFNRSRINPIETGITNPESVFKSIGVPFTDEAVEFTKMVRTPDIHKWKDEITYGQFEQFMGGVNVVAEMNRAEQEGEKPIRQIPDVKYERTKIGNIILEPPQGLS